MQPVSVIAPFNQVSNAQNSTPSSTTDHTRTTHHLIPPNTTQPRNNNNIKRNQSFHGFHNAQRLPQVPAYSISGSINNAYSFSQMSLQSCPSKSFQYLPGTSRQVSRNNSLCETVSLNRSYNRTVNTNHLMIFAGNTSSTISPQSKRIIGRRLSHHQLFKERIAGRNEVQFIRRTASGIIMSDQQSTIVPKLTDTDSTKQLNLTNSEKMLPALNKQENAADNGTREQNTDNVINNNNSQDQKGPNKIMNRMRASNRRLATIAEKRFGSLDIRKHRCYSPTFYSMRCKKHAKKRPIIVALPKKCFSELALAKEPSDKFENLTDSIQILEESNSSVKVSAEEMPKPAPRCRKHSKEIVYANVNKFLSKTGINKEGAEINNGNQVTKVDLHLPTETNLDDIDGRAIVDSKQPNAKPSEPFNKQMNTVSLSSKSAPQKPTISSHALKNSPILKVSPNFIKPMNESPKGALSKQLQAKIKCSPLHNSSITSVESSLNSSSNAKIPDPSSPAIVGLKKIKLSDDDLKNDEHCSNVPSMPLLNPQNMWSPNQSNVNAQVCFLFFSLTYIS